MILSVEEATDLVADALIASDTSAANARSAAAALVGAELAGQVGHGLRRVPAYAAQARAGKVKGHAVPRAERVRPGVVHIDAGHGFAFPALDLAVAELADIAPAQGIALAGIRRSHHAGVAGLTVEALARKGLAALMFTNAPAAMAPWGATRPLFGTNPIAFAAPVPDGDPIVVDVSLSRVARGKIMAAAQKGEDIPEGWALDDDGRPTRDPKAALAGTMVPLGGAKGTALALMVELLAAGLTGANFADAQSSFFDAEGAPPGTGQSLIAIDPSSFGGTAAVARFGAMARTIERTEGARVPGHRRAVLARRMEASGIEIDPGLHSELRALASGLSSTGPSPSAPAP